MQPEASLEGLMRLKARDSHQLEDKMPRNMPERDDQGRFVSDDDRGRGGDDCRRYASSRRDDDYRRSSRYDDDDRGRGHGGWFGDSRGHAEAARRGWDERREDRDYDDRRRYSSREDDYDDRRSRYDDDDRGRGWYGDSPGHAEAARRGWDERRDHDYDDRRRYSSSRRDDDDRRSSRYEDDDRGRGHRGWFGDPRGHAEAARRGWDERRDDDYGDRRRR